MFNQLLIPITIFWSIKNIDASILRFFSNKFPQAAETNLLFRYLDKNTLDTIFKGVTKMGEGYFELALIGILLILIRINSEKKEVYHRYIKGVIFSFLSSGILVSILKHLFGRARPYVEFNPSGFYGAFNLIKQHLFFNAKYYSFPSGHTMTIWTTVWFLYLNIENKVLKSLLFIIAALVGISRIYLSYHWFSDVTASILISYGIARYIDKNLDSKKLKLNIRKVFLPSY